MGHVLDWEELDVDVPHGGVDDGAVRHPLGALGLCGGHHLLLGRLLVEHVAVRLCALGVHRLPPGELDGHET